MLHGRGAGREPARLILIAAAYARVRRDPERGILRRWKVRVEGLLGRASRRSPASVNHRSSQVGSSSSRDPTLPRTMLGLASSTQPTAVLHGEGDCARAQISAFAARKSSKFPAAIAARMSAIKL